MQIRLKMSYEKTANGVRVTETSDDPYVAQLIKAHAKTLSAFVERGFAEAMKNHPVPDLKKGPQNTTLEYINPAIKQYGKVVKLPHAVHHARDESKINGFHSFAHHEIDEEVDQK